MLYGDISARLVNVAIIDSWEDGDFAEWTGDLGNWSTQSTFTTDGALGARYSASANAVIERTTGEDRLPEQGDTFAIDFQTATATANSTATDETRIRFAEDGTNWYEVHLSVSGGNVEFWVRGSTNSRYVNVSHSFAANTHYELKVVWDDGSLGGSPGDFTITLTDKDAETVVAEGTGNDTSLTDGTVKIQMNMGEQNTWDFDYWRITNPGDGPVSGPTGATAGEEWTLEMSDDFSGSSLDTTKWGIGFGFGTTSSNDDADVSADRVSVENSLLVLEVKSEGDGSTVTQGAVNTKDGGGSWNPDGNPTTFSPPVWIEARESPITREGVLPAFWAKPNNENWPPELDVMEVFHDGDATDPERTHQNVHYAASGACDDETNVQTLPNTWDNGADVGEEFHVYGAKWERDRLDFYVDGTVVYTITDQAALDALANANCNPFYLMFTNHVNRIGTADLSTAWTETHHVDWCRVWNGPIPYVDGFNDGDLSEYTGDTGGFSTVTSPTAAGTGGALSGSGWATNRITSSAGLDNYPGKGDEFEWWVRKSSTDATYSVQNIYFGFADTNNWFRGRINWNTGNHYMDLESQVAGTESNNLVAIDSFTMDAGKWYRNHVTWDDGATFGGADGEVTWTIEDADSTASHSTTLTESAHTEAGIGFGTDDGSGPTFYWDEWRLL